MATAIVPGGAQHGAISAGAGGKPHQGVLLRGKSSHAQTISLLVALTLTLLAGCGGGGGGGGGPTSGGGQIIEPPPPPPDPVTITQATVRGTSAADLIDVLQDHASGGPWGPEDNTWRRWPQLPLWEGQPIVRVQSSRGAPSTSAWLRAPSTSSTTGSPWSTAWSSARRHHFAQRTLRTFQPGEIHVSFSSPHRGGQSRYNESGDRYRTDDVPRMVSNLVVVNPDFFATESRHEVYGALAHELVHAMGLPGHVYEGDHPTSLMPDGLYRGGGLPDEAGLPRLPRIDGEALMTAYALYDDGETHDDIHDCRFARAVGTHHPRHQRRSAHGRRHCALRRRVPCAVDACVGRGAGAGDATGEFTPSLARLSGPARWSASPMPARSVEGDAGITVDIADIGRHRRVHRPHG